MIGRRELMVGAASLVAAPQTAAAYSTSWGSLPVQLDAINAASGGRVGVALLDVATGRSVGHRASERFAMCSTFKMLLAAQALSEVDAGRLSLDRRIPVAAADILANSPVTETRVGADISVAELCKATITLSDNAAANLLTARLGGPARLTAFLRRIGDRTTRCDRIEPMLNRWQPGELRDTTTPAAVAQTWRTLLFGDALSAKSRVQLTEWVVANQTGGPRLRAGLPRTWRVGDKTGNDGVHTTNDVAVIWPGQKTPVILAVFHSQGSRDGAARDAVLASVARAAAAVL